jgi:lauroyl/myristoyl acyltransferase
VSLAMRTGTPLVPGLLVDHDGTYRFVAGEIWRPDPQLGEEENLRAGAVHFHRFLEESVRRDPANYFWAHRRWKTRPPAGEDPAR